MRTGCWSVESVSPTTTSSSFWASVPLPEPVVGHPQQLAEIDPVREELPVRAQDPQRLVLVPPVQRPGPPDQRLLELGAVPPRLGSLPGRRRRRPGPLDGLLARRLAGLLPLVRTPFVGRPAVPARWTMRSDGRLSPLARATASSATDRTVRASSAARLSSRRCRGTPDPRNGPNPRFRLRSARGRPDVSPRTGPALAGPHSLHAGRHSLRAGWHSLRRRPALSPRRPALSSRRARALRTVAATPRTPAPIAVGASRPRTIGALGSLFRIPGVRPTVVHRSPPARRSRVRHRPAISNGAADAQEPRRSGALAG